MEGLTQAGLVELCRGYLSTLHVTLWSQFFELRDGADGLDEAAEWFAQQITQLIAYKER